MKKTFELQKVVNVSIHIDEMESGDIAALEQLLEDARKGSRHNSTVSVAYVELKEFLQRSVNEAKDRIG